MQQWFGTWNQSTLRIHAAPKINARVTKSLINPSIIITTLESILFVQKYDKDDKLHTTTNIYHWINDHLKIKKK